MSGTLTPSLRNEVADAPQRTDHVGAELATQRMDVDLDRIAFDRLIPAIQPILQLPARQHRARALQQCLQYRELVGRQQDRRSALLHGVGNRIEPDAAMLDVWIA